MIRWGHQCSWTLTPASSMPITIIQSDDCNQAYIRQCLNLLCQEGWGVWGSTQVLTYLCQLIHLYFQFWSSHYMWKYLVRAFTSLLKQRKEVSSKPEKTFWHMKHSWHDLRVPQLTINKVLIHELGHSVVSNTVALYLDRLKPRRYKFKRRMQVYPLTGVTNTY